MLDADLITERIKGAMPDAEVKAIDTTGEGDHWDVEVVSSAFANVSMVNQHRMVYDCFKDLIGGAMHALALKTKTPT